MGNCFGILLVDFGEDYLQSWGKIKRYAFIHISQYQNIEGKGEIEEIVETEEPFMFFDTMDEALDEGNYLITQDDSVYYASKMGIWLWNAEKGDWK